jgi:hypothetical protein
MKQEEPFENGLGLVLLLLLLDRIVVVIVVMAFFPNVEIIALFLEAGLFIICTTGHGLEILASKAA